MLAAVALVLGTVVLVKMQRTKYIWVTVIPAAWLLLCTTWALGLKLFSTNPQMEGFFFMAQQYKEKIAAGGELTAQQIANMNQDVYKRQGLRQGAAPDRIAADRYLSPLCQPFAEAADIRPPATRGEAAAVVFR